MASLTIENYVKTIYQICAGRDEHPASTGELASALGVLPGTVTSMLKTLNDAGLAAYTPYEGVQLTEAGRTLALRVVRRHRLIELFLVKTLELNWDEVHEEAENMEHAVSDRLIDRIDAYLGHPSSDPHGDPIPTADGTVRDADSWRLTDWHGDHRFRLVRVLDQAPSFLRYLSRVGLLLGVEGEVAGRQDEAGTVTIRVGERTATLSQAAAQKLLVAAPHD